MLEHLENPPVRHLGGDATIREAFIVRDEPDDQQERPARESVAGILRDHTSDIRVFRMKIWSDLQGDMQGGSPPLDITSSNCLSEIPCRVSSDPHERRNDLAAVSKRDPAKLRYP